MIVRHRILLFVAAGLFSVSLLHAEAPYLLSTAMHKLASEDGQWAYTQVMRRTDRIEPATVARFDPSRPSGDQWELITLKGRTPSDAEAARWCNRRGRESKRTDGAALIELLDLDQARISTESAGHVRYEVPLKKSTVARLPTENFVAFVDVNRADESLKKFSFVLRATVKLIGGMAEIQSAQGEVTFNSIDQSESTRPTRITASGTGQALFKKVNRSAEIIYTDQRRVKS